MPTGRILICEDERNIVSFLRAELLHAGYEADVACDGETALSLLAEGDYDLALLDLMLPRRSGLEVLQSIRGGGSDMPVIVITARKDSFDKVLLLKSGADDYVTKPFDNLELLARIERSIERGRGAKGREAYRLRDLRVDYAGFTAAVGEESLRLTKTEFEILYQLMKNMRRVLSRERILGLVYGDFFGNSNVVDVNVKNIRRKIAALTSDSYIETVRGKGYVAR
jgi:two-component system response regulator ArlR